MSLNLIQKSIAEKQPEDLKLRIQRYFFKKYKLTLNDDEANLCLESLADLFLAFGGNGSGKPPP